MPKISRHDGGSPGSPVTGESDGNAWRPTRRLRRLRTNPDGARARLAVGAVALMTLISLAVVFFEISRATRPDSTLTAVPVPSPSRVYDAPVCGGADKLSGIHGTDCKSLPVITVPGELGPANTGGPAGGTDWEPAFPGSNVWIPKEQISGRLIVLPSEAAAAPPDGYEQIGQTPDGALLYWRVIEQTLEPPVPEPAQDHD